MGACAPILENTPAVDGRRLLVLSIMSVFVAMLWPVTMSGVLIDKSLHISVNLERQPGPDSMRDKMVGT